MVQNYPDIIRIIGYDSLPYEIIKFQVKNTLLSLNNLRRRIEILESQQNVQNSKMCMLEQKNQ